jgi:molybdate transport system permease protein
VTITPKIFSHDPGKTIRKMRPPAMNIHASRKLALAVAVVSIGLMVSYLALPIISLFFHTSPLLFFSSLQEQQVIEALVLSFITAGIALLVIILIGTPAAYFHSRFDYTGKRFVDILIDLPLVLPPAVAGLALLLFYGRMGFFGKYLNIIGITIPFTTSAVILAQIFVASPFYIRNAKGLFEQLDPVYEQTGQTLGASPLRVFATIAIPLTARGLVSGIVMTFARALGEFGATIMVAGNLPGITQTMPLAIYGALEGNFNVAITISILLVLISFGIMAAISIITRKRGLLA